VDVHVLVFEVMAPGGLDVQCRRALRGGPRRGSGRAALQVGGGLYAALDVELGQDGGHAPSSRSRSTVRAASRFHGWFGRRPRGRGPAAPGLTASTGARPLSPGSRCVFAGAGAPRSRDRRSSGRPPGSVRLEPVHRARRCTEGSRRLPRGYRRAERPPRRWPPGGAPGCRATTIGSLERRAGRRDALAPPPSRRRRVVGLDRRHRWPPGRCQPRRARRCPPRPRGSPAVRCASRRTRGRPRPSSGAPRRSLTMPGSWVHFPLRAPPACGPPPRRPDVVRGQVG
jgi:hypothetical protein